MQDSLIGCTFHLDIDESCLDVKIPRLTLQPIVENAIIHAIEPVEDGGSIWFRIIEELEHVRIEIEDDGPGDDGRKSTADASIEKDKVGRAFYGNRD